MAPMWDRIDPLAEKYYGISPYAYCGGDPVNFGDYDGREISLSGDSALIAQAIAYYNQGAGREAFSYDYENKKVVYNASSDPSEFEQTIGDIVNSDKSVELNLTSKNRQVLVGSLKHRAIDLGDLSGMESHGFDPSRVMLHETVEQFNLDWGVLDPLFDKYEITTKEENKKIIGNKINELVSLAHDRALGAESRCFNLGGNPSNDIIPHDYFPKSGFFVVRELSGRLFVMPYAKGNIR